LRTLPWHAAATMLFAIIRILEFAVRLWRLVARHLKDVP
jgi:hypothetical protein